MIYLHAAASACPMPHAHAPAAIAAATATDAATAGQSARAGLGGAGAERNARSAGQLARSTLPPARGSPATEGPRPPAAARPAVQTSVLAAVGP